jgi:DMSO/TMAO reductase YedYZ molybdopterin-dependent catalytic subunit
MYSKPISHFLLIFCLVFLSFLTFGQSSETAFVRVEGEVLRPLKLTIEDLKQLPAHEVRVAGMQGVEQTFKGVRLVDVLEQAGVTLGRDLRGENLTKSLLMAAADGYEVLYSLAEIDPEFTDEVVILAYEKDGKPLPMGEGPFRIIAPSDKRPARWIRELQSIKVLFPKD